MLSKNHKKKLFLLDAFALIYRSYFAFAKNPRINTKGQNTSAAFGFTNALIDVLQKEKPTHIAVVFDAPGPSNRVQDFAEYKANRQETPEDIKNMIPYIKKIIEAFNIPILMKQGFEADDVIGTLSKIAENEGFLTYMMTPDKDFGQLVTENSLIYKPGRGIDPPAILGVKEVCEKFEIDDPIKVIDILGLWGDSSDNIPGIPGIGEKTAKKLIQEFGSVENVILNADKLKGKLLENVKNYAEQGILSKNLATIITDVDVVFDPEDLKLSSPDLQKIRDVFTELEFRNLAKRITGEEIIVTKNNNNSVQLDLFGSQSLIEEQKSIETYEFKTIITEKAKYHLVSNSEERAHLLNILNSQKEVCFDTETSSLNSLEAELLGIAFSFKEKEAYYVAMPDNEEDKLKILNDFNEFFTSSEIEKIGHNLKYDIQVLKNYQIDVQPPLFDTMLAHYLIQPEMKQSMDFLSEYYLKYKPISIETLIGKKGKNQNSMKDLTAKEIFEYACEDADITFQLKKIFENEVVKEHLKYLFYNIEMPLMNVLSKMEREGISIDVNNLFKLSDELNIETINLEKEIKKIAGTDFNLDSPKQLGIILFEYMKISSKAKKTKTGQYQTSEETLVQYKNDHHIIPLILNYRECKKLKSTYVDTLPTMLSKKDGRIHTSFMQTVTSTGRLSSNSPNLQNIPVKTERGKEIRKSFVARDNNYKLMSADYSQIELRIIAALSNDEVMIQAFNEGKDIHKATASNVFKIPLNEVTKEQRNAAKAVNFGIIYGQSAFGLSQNLNISRTEAKDIIDKYFIQFPKIKQYIDETISFAREFGFVQTIMKRRRYLPDIHSANAIVRGFAERNAINAPIQGSAADIIKLAMIKVDNEIKKYNLESKLLLQVHDELVFDVLIPEIDVMTKIVKSSMESAVKLSVPLYVEINTANNWLDAH